MLDEVDVAPIVTAIDDRSPRVRRAALKVIALLLPHIRGDSVYNRLLEKVDSPDEDIRALARDAFDAAARSTPRETIDEDPADDAAKPYADLAQTMPERWREIVAEEGNAYSRLDAALKLAAWATLPGLSPLSTTSNEHPGIWKSSVAFATASARLFQPQWPSNFALSPTMPRVAAMSVSWLTCWGAAQTKAAPLQIHPTSRSTRQPSLTNIYNATIKSASAGKTPKSGVMSIRSVPHC
jgi:hypothetical protein